MKTWIGEGSFAKVYLVTEPDKEERYAYKESREKEILYREYEVMKGLCHPLFPKVYDYWEDGAYGMMKLEYIPGQTLRKMSRRRGGCSARQVLEMGIALARGLRYLHMGKTPIIYRDLKPENIMVCEDGTLKLLDFGSALVGLRGDGVRTGTPGFAPPEQLEGREDVNYNADVYALGQTLKAVLRSPQGGEAGTHKALRSVLDCCTSPDEKLRPPDMDAVLQALYQLRERRRRGRLGGGKQMCWIKNIRNYGCKTSC